MYDVAFVSSTGMGTLLIRQHQSYYRLLGNQTYTCIYWYIQDSEADVSITADNVAGRDTDHVKQGMLQGQARSLYVYRLLLYIALHMTETVVFDS